MRKFFVSVLLAGMACVNSPASAAILIDLLNAPVQSQTFFKLPFVAATSSTFAALGGYQLPSFIQATQIALMPDSSDVNLLALTWQYTPAPTNVRFGFYTQQYDDSPHKTGTNAVEFGSTVIGAYDYYSQYVPTSPGSNYTLSFLYSQDYPGPNEFKVTIDEPLTQDPILPAVPEPASWAMMLSGFAFIGAASRRRQRNRLAA